MIKPFSPSDVQSKQIKSIPEKVIDCVNNLLVKKWNGFCAYFSQNEIIEQILLAYESEIANSETSVDEFRRQIFENHWLDFEELYQKQGWSVSYSSNYRVESAIYTFSSNYRVESASYTFRK